MSTFDRPELVKLGTCDLIEQIMIGEDVLLRFSGVALGEACTIVVRGATQQILDEAERFVKIHISDIYLIFVHIPGLRFVLMCCLT